VAPPTVGYDLRGSPGGIIEGQVALDSLTLFLEQVADQRLEPLPFVDPNPIQSTCSLLRGKAPPGELV
jgi:hypothetical protein